MGVRNLLETGTAVDLALIIGAALADSLNPCMFAVMVLLLTQLSIIRARKRAKKIGSIYIGIIYLSYLGLGLLIAHGLKLLGFVSALYGYVKLSVAVVVALAGVINIKDFFAYGKGISLRIPRSQVERIKKLAIKGTVPAILTLGLLVTLIELPCTGAMYLAIIAYMVARKVEATTLLTYLVIYNLIFIAPLVLILLAYLKGTSSQRLESFRLKHRAKFRLIMGLALLFLAYLVWVI